MKTREQRLWNRLEKIMRYLRIDRMERENEIKKARQKMWKQTLGLGCFVVAVINTIS